MDKSLKASKFQVGEGWIGSLGLADANYLYRTDKQQGPTV